MGNFTPQPTEGILCIHSLQNDLSGEYMGIDLIFTKTLFYSNFEKISPVELKLLSVIHAMMYIKKEKIYSYVYINCKETISLIESKNFLNLTTSNEKLSRAIRWMLFEKRLPHVFLWDENMWTNTYEILKEIT